MSNCGWVKVVDEGNQGFDWKIPDEEERFQERMFSLILENRTVVREAVFNNQLITSFVF